MNIILTPLLTPHGECRPGQPLCQVSPAFACVPAHPPTGLLQDLGAGGPGINAECKSGIPRKASYEIWHKVQRDSSPSLASRCY